ncbi:TolB family protein [Emticicia sp. 17c]|uniref:TolB family protein n=1 Tax=Emticicia sp. 17c TaxID=3127704 RepID=UPI00301C8048
MKQKLPILLFIILSSCAPKIYQTTSEGENFDTLTQITDSDKPSYYPSGGDFGENLVFVMKEEDGSYNMYMREKVLNKVLVQKSSGQNINLAPNYSTANNRIVFQYLDKTNYDIYYIEAGKGKAITQVTNTDEDEYNPSWSPDGNLIIFEKGATPRTYLQATSKSAKIEYRGAVVTKNQIWVKDLKTNELKMIGVGSFPRISPDGKSVAFIRYDLDKKKSKETGTLWIMSLDGESPKQITNASLGYATSPNWSPDGKKLIFQLTKKNKEDSDIYTIDINGENLRQYTVNKSNDFAPIWTADDFVYFCSDRGAKPDKYQIWRFKMKK